MSSGSAPLRLLKIVIRVGLLIATVTVMRALIMRRNIKRYRPADKI
jgi:hypothetical protein